MRLISIVISSLTSTLFFVIVTCSRMHQNFTKILNYDNREEVLEIEFPHHI